MKPLHYTDTQLILKAKRKHDN